jgi:GNAT superfamily N-acetyltransferase
MNMLSTGYSDVPNGKIAAIVTHLEMAERRPARPEPSGHGWSVLRIEQPSTTWYRDVYRRIGEHWLWFSRLRMADAQLAALLGEPAREVYVLQADGVDEGLFELHFRAEGVCDLVFFGVTGPLIGTGAGRVLMNRAIELAWSRPIRRFILNTCTLDHPSALGFYIRSGFVPMRRQVELADDPRLDGTLPREAAPQVPIIEP